MIHNQTFFISYIEDWKIFSSHDHIYVVQSTSLCFHQTEQPTKNYVQLTVWKT